LRPRKAPDPDGEVPSVRFGATWYLPLADPLDETQAAGAEYFSCQEEDEDMSYESLEELLQAAGNPVELARNSQIGPYVYPGVPSEFTNWRDEQRAWMETCVLFDQSHHMTDLYIEGPDVIRLLSDLGVNSFKNFAVNKAKQFVACNHDGHVIGDGIIFFLNENKVCLVGRPSAHNWVQYHAETGAYDVKLERDERTAVNPTGRRKLYRYQVQGPTALKVLERAVGGPLPDIKFFNMDEVTIAGRKVRALHHGMSGAPGLELFGPWEEAEAVRAAVVDAGQEFGLRQVGSRVYATNTLESGWIPSPLPAVFTGERMKGYRKWLPASGYEATGSLGGSYYSDDITDYYLTPHDLGYWPFVKFDHDFIGREALEHIADKPNRKKVTLAWKGEDVARAMGTMFKKGDMAKYIDLPLSNYSTWPYDKVLKGDEVVGLSTFSGYSYNERSMLSLAMVDVDVEIGTELVLVWGEEGGGSSKPVVEPHVQAEIRAVVSPCPYSEVARTSYAEGWRTKAAPV
jgi:vanillate/3-O-methylgallate O-demethylase